jgi:UDP-glucose 4-epimerase
MNILVTGGAGFIGSHIVDSYIENGHKVTVIDNLSTGKEENLNPKADFIQMDINDERVDDIFKKNKFDILNHQAAQIDVRISVDDPVFDAKTNIIGSINLYEACRKYKVKKIIYASSGGAIYGEQDYFPADEEHPLRPCSPYGITKLVNEKYLFYYKEIFGIENVILRYANVYGPRQNPFGEAGVVAIFTNKMLNNEKAVINGNGKNTRDYVYVSDVVKANFLALDDNVSGTYNIATGIEHDVNFIFNELKDLTGTSIDEIHGEAKRGEQLRSVCSYQKIFNEHNWSPEIKLDKGLKKTVDYFRSLK